MAYGMVYRPGSKLGSCEEGCKHPHCEVDHLIAACFCTSCKEVIGYDRAFFAVQEGFIHAVCYWDVVKTGRRKKLAENGNGKKIMAQAEI